MATTTKTQPKKTAKKVTISEMKPGDVFSELSHYTYTGKKGADTLLFTHHASGATGLALGVAYVEKYLCPANQWQAGEEVEVGREDKYWTAKQIAEAVAAGELPKDVKLQPREGDVRVPGIRTIWENIHSSHVFSVCFQKQGKALSNKKIEELQAAQAKQAIDANEKASRAKKGIAAAAIEEIAKIQQNPISAFEPGEMRTLIGYKVQFTSRDGRYDCVDMKIPEGENNIRPVNINTIEWLVFDGKKYIVK